MPQGHVCPKHAIDHNTGNLKRKKEGAETEKVSGGKAYVGGNKFVFRHVDVELMGKYPSEMILQLAEDKRMKLNKDLEAS